MLMKETLQFFLKKYFTVFITLFAVESYSQILRSDTNDLANLDRDLNASDIVYDPNTFAIIGDYGSNYSQEGSVANLVKSWNPGFIITAGDNNYPDGASSTIDVNIGKYYHNYIYPYTGSYGTGSDINRFFPCLGNHDVTTSSGGPYFQYFALPNNERYYDFIKGNIHFFVINSNSSEPSGNSASSVQATWLKNKLAASTSVWNIVYFHHSPYCSDAVHGSTSVMQWPFKSWGADLVVSSHSHVYERILKDNFTYIVNGLGGHSKYTFKSTPVSGSQIRYNANYGAIKVSVTTDALYFRFYNISNNLIDTYILPKPGSTSPTCEAKITPGSSTTFCAGGKVTLSTNIVAGRSYQWKKDGVNISGATSSSYTATQAGDYQVKISSTDCVAWSAPTKVTINTSLVAKITPGGPTTFCNGGSVKLFANTCSGYIYQWKKDGSNISVATANYYVATTSGSYQVKIISGTSAAWSALVSVVTTSCRENDSIMTTTDSIPLKLISENDDFKINVFPNPTTGLFTFEFCLDDLQKEGLTIDVLNSIGQIVYSKHKEEVSGCVNQTIELANDLSTGIYILRLSIGERTENLRVMLSR